MIDVTRAAEAPASLAANDRYDGEDVITTLHRDFLGKCYLCETSIQLGTFTIDHRKPQGERQFPELRCAWTNLFPTCNTHRCNERRKKRYPPGGLLDPGDGVEARLHQRLERPSAVLASAAASLSFAAAQAGDVAAENTAAELDRIHNGTDASGPARRTASALRGAILLHVELIAQKLRDLQTEAADASDRALRIAELRVLFSRRAPYTMLVRSCLAGLPAARELFDDVPPA